MRKFFTLFLFLFSASCLFGQTTLTEWNFPNNPDDAIADVAIPLNTAKTIATVGANAASFGAAGATTNSATAGNWTTGAGTKYWQVEVTTTGYNTLTLSSKQRSSDTGPRDFILEYRIGAAGVWTPVVGGNVLTANNYTSGVLINIALPAACNDQPSVFIRWIMATNTAVDGTPVVGTGNSNIDDIRIRGFLIVGAALPGNYYRTVQSGTWDDASTWETSVDNTTWIPTSVVPTDAANAITINATHIVTINNTASANKLTINTGGSLIHNAGVAFSLFDAAGTDMTIFGSYTINGTMPSGTSTIRVETNGSVFAQTNTGGESDDFAYSPRVTFANLSNFYWSGGTFVTAGITYFPNSGVNDRPRFIINANTGVVGGNTQTIINGYLDVRADITFQNAGAKTFRDGIITSAGATLTQSNTSGQFIINGAFPNLGGAGIIILNAVTGLLIPAGVQAGLINNQQINNSTFTVNGELFAYEYQITGSTNFNLAGTLYTRHANGISLTGTLANTGTKVLGANSIVAYDRLLAEGDQQFTSRTDYANVHIYGGSQKILNGPAIMSGQLLLDNGLVVTTAANLLTITATGSSFGGNTNSFVTGPLRKIGNAAFVFPVGKLVGATNHYRTISISAPDDVADEFTAEFIRGNARLLGANTAIGLQRVSQCEYWTLDHVNSGAATAVNVTIGWTAQSPCNVSYVTDLSTLVIAHFNGTSWDSYGGGGTATGAVSPGAGTITWNGVNTFSPFALGTTSVALNPLPLDLSSFSARAKNGEVVIDWHVMNNDEQEEYILERSRDGVNFEQLRKVPAKVILNQAAYTEVDQHPLSGWNYYRLRAIDKLGREKKSFTVKVWFGLNELIRISPNPASEKIVINLSEPSSISEIELVNISGQVLKKINNIQFYTELNISHLQAGFYYLRILGKYGLTIKSFVKN